MVLKLIHSLKQWVADDVSFRERFAEKEPPV
jgi:hypothetical protein